MTTAMQDDSTPTPSPIDPLKKKRRLRRIILIVSIAVVVLGGSGVAAYVLLQHKKVVTTTTEKKKVVKEVPKPKYYSPLTGNEVADQAATTQPVTAVMIENSPNARPQSGLKDSGTVFEAIAEGGITRFMVLYQQEKPTLIGPVRSARLYDVEWLNPFQASLAHVGGSAAALAEVRNGSYRDIDQFFNSAYYWRATDRYAPHNVYTNFEKLDQLNAAKGYTSSSFQSFDRIDREASKAPTASNVAVTISSTLYNSNYTYNPTTDSYDRSQGGEPHLDRESGQISPRVVIIIKVQESTVYEDGWRENIVTTGSGEAYVFQNGVVQAVTWKKDAKTSPLQLIDAAGASVTLDRGQTWITAIPNDTGAVSWN